MAKHAHVFMCARCHRGIKACSGDPVVAYNRRQYHWDCCMALHREEREAEQDHAADVHKSRSDAAKAAHARRTT